MERELSEIEERLLHVLGFARKLKELSKTTMIHEEVSRLQDEQAEFIEQLVSLNESFQETYQIRPTQVGSPQSERIQTLVEEFNKINEEFMTNIMVRQGLVKEELKLTSKSLQSLRDVKGMYGVQPQEFVSGTKINTLS